jgi:hypothetical protein
MTTSPSLAGVRFPAHRRTLPRSSASPGFGAPGNCSHAAFTVRK